MRESWENHKITREVTRNKEIGVLISSWAWENILPIVRATLPTTFPVSWRLTVQMPFCSFPANSFLPLPIPPHHHYFLSPPSSLFFPWSSVSLTTLLWHFYLCATILLSSLVSCSYLSISLLPLVFYCYIAHLTATSRYYLSLSCWVTRWGRKARSNWWDH